MYALTIIGFGASLRQDDGFGPKVIEVLEQRGQDLGSDVCLKVSQTLTPELAETLSQSTRVIFIDASAELGPGEVQFRPVTADSTADVSLVHFLTPEALLVWTSRLYGRVPAAELWLVGVKETGLSEELTVVVSAQIEPFVMKLEERIRQARRT